MSVTRWPRVEATILRHLARRPTPTATAEDVATATGLPHDDAIYALEALYERGEVDTFVDGGVRRWQLPDADGEA
ncbi:MAG: hypothetical protein ABEH78_05830 [Haloferacaceae archaeon]